MDNEQQNTGASTLYPTNDEGILPTLSVDCVIFGLSGKQLKILLVKHAIGESQGEWGLPGGYIYEKESLDDAAARLLNYVTGVNDVYLEQLQAFSEPNRVTGRRVITFAFYALVQPEHHHPAVTSSTLDCQWIDIKSVPPMHFDHSDILQKGIDRLRRKVRYEPIGVNLLPPKFSLGQLQDLYEAILDKKLDKPNFRRKMLRMNFLVRCNETQDKVPHRAGALYRFDADVYKELCEGGFSFEF